MDLGLDIANGSALLRALDLIIEDDANREPVAEWALQRLGFDEVWGHRIRILHRLIKCAEQDEPGVWYYSREDFEDWKADAMRAFVRSDGQDNSMDF